MYIYIYMYTHICILLYSLTLSFCKSVGAIPGHTSNLSCLFLFLSIVVALKIDLHQSHVAGLLRNGMDWY